MTLRALLFGTGATSKATDIGLLIIRLGFGLMMAFGHGLGKIPPSQGFIDGAVAGMGLPAPELFAWLAALSEFLGGLLIALGLLTRPAAAFLSVTMAVAFFVTHGGALSGDNSGEMAFLYLVVGVALAVAGAGRYALDSMVWRRTATIQGARL